MRPATILGISMIMIMISLASCASTKNQTVAVKPPPKVIVVKQPRANRIVVVNSGRHHHHRHGRVVVFR